MKSITEGRKLAANRILADQITAEQWLATGEASTDTEDIGSSTSIVGIRH